jgi:tetratricopeptide (TPR) repeat protein
LRCYNAMIAGLLETAGESCDESISRHARNIGVYDTRGLLDLKNHDWDRAIADFTQSLYYRPALSTSLYGRALAHRAKGETAAAAADTQAATEAEPHIAEILARIGVQADTGTKPTRKT